MTDLPTIALSVRQPWAWAIVAGHKDIENRTAHAIRLGGMKRGRICIHAAKGMTRAEYESARAFMAKRGVTCPAPADLVRGAIVGTVYVADIVNKSSNRWFVGPKGLWLQEPTQLDSPIPAAGALGYFEWTNGGMIDPPKPWMVAWSEPLRI